MSDEKKQITGEDIAVEGSSYLISLVKLLEGKKIKDIHGYLSQEFGDATFKISYVLFEDDSQIGVEGEHDFPYLTDYPRWPQPNFDEDTLNRLHDETLDEDESEEDEQDER